MSKNINKIKENSFDGAGGGSNGTTSYGNDTGTFVSPDVTQDPDHFEHNDENKPEAQGATSNLRKNNVSMAALKKDVNQIFSKKATPSSDQVISGLDYEMGRMIKKDKVVAKQNVLANLKKDPNYYTNLNQLNSSEEAITQNMTENTNLAKEAANKAETIKIFNEMAAQKDNKYYVDPRICEVMKELTAAKKLRSSWKET